MRGPATKTTFQVRVPDTSGATVFGNLLSEGVRFNDQPVAEVGDLMLNGRIR